jgi:hypothetical protein
MAIFNSYVSLPEGIRKKNSPDFLLVILPILPIGTLTVTQSPLVLSCWNRHMCVVCIETTKKIGHKILQYQCLAENQMFILLGQAMKHSIPSFDDSIPPVVLPWNLLQSRDRRVIRDLSLATFEPRSRGRCGLFIPTNGTIIFWYDVNMLPEAVDDLSWREWIWFQTYIPEID